MRRWIPFARFGLLILLAGCQPPNNVDKTNGANTNQNEDRPKSGPSQQPVSSPRTPDPERLAEKGQHWEAVQLAAKLSSQDPKRLKQEIQLRNLLGFRQTANSKTREWIKREDPDLGQLIGLSHPTRPWVNFESKPDPADAQQRDRFGMQSILYALQLHGDTCETLDTAEAGALARQRVPEMVSLLMWIQSVCQRDDAVLSQLLDVPDECRHYPAFWVALGNIAQSMQVSPLSAETRSIQSKMARDFYRMALRLEPNHLIACRAALAAVEDSDTELKSVLEQSATSILDIQTLVNDIANQTEHPAILVPKLAAIQNKSGRPIESIAWQTLMVNKMGGDPKRIEALRESRRKLLLRYPDGYDFQKIVGPLDPAQVNLDADMLIRRVLRDRQDSVDVPLLAKGESGDETSGCRFVDVTDDLAVDFQWLGTAEPLEANFRLFEPLGGGIAWTDFDNDGSVDLFLVQASGDPKGMSSHSDKLFRSQGGEAAEFRDVSRLASVGDANQKHAYGHGVTAGDWNQDGWEDLVIVGIDATRLLINQGDGTYRNATSQLNVDSSKDKDDYPVSMSVAIADLTDNGLPDLYETRYVNDPSVFDPIRFDSTGKPINLPSPTGFRSGSDHIYSQSPSGVVQVYPLDQPRTGMGVVVGDFVHSGTNQIYVANDQLPNQFWSLNQSHSETLSNTWTDSATPRGVAVGPNGKSLAGMGIAVGDFDFNGLPDFHVTNFADEWANLYLQSPGGSFLDRSVVWRLSSDSGPMVGFGCQAFDVNNDRRLDLVVGNGHIEDLRSLGVAFRMPTQVFQGVANGFERVKPESVGDYFSKNHLARSVATADLDHDGRVDFAVSHVLEKTRVFRNETDTENHWISIQLVATRGERSAVGSVVTVIDDDGSRSFTQKTGDGYLARNEPVIHVGLGSNESDVRIEVRWNNQKGISQTFDSVSVDRRVLLVEGQAPWLRSH